MRVIGTDGRQLEKFLRKLFITRIRDSITERVVR